MRKVTTKTPFLILILLALTLAWSASAVFADSGKGQARAVAAQGVITLDGEDVIVEILVAVRPGENAQAAAQAALKRAYPGAREIDSAEFSTTGLVWDVFLDGDPGNDQVKVNYNGKGVPGSPAGYRAALVASLTAWTAVATSNFVFTDGGDTGRCPSLVRECKGPQKFDGNNDVGWIDLKDPGVLGVAWYGTSTDEFDIALDNKDFAWYIGDPAGIPANAFDAQTVWTQELGHGLGLGHSNVDGAVMEPFYEGVRRVLHQDDKDGISFLYPGGPTNDSPVVFITSPADVASFATGATISFAGTASDTEDAGLSAAALVWTSNGVQIGTGGSFSAVLSDGSHTITASATDSDSSTGSASVSITVVNNAPSVSITSPADGASFATGATISFAGTASDVEDAGLSAANLVWTSDGVQIGTGGSFSTTLSDGGHTITASATDSGSQTGSASIDIWVGPQPEQPTSVSVTSVTYATQGGKDGKKHLLITITLVDDLSGDVSGASVSITLNNGGQSWVGTGTTGDNGTVTFSLKNAPNGLYTTLVDNVTATGLTWVEGTPLNGFTK